MDLISNILLKVVKMEGYLYGILVIHRNIRLYRHIIIHLIKLYGIQLIKECWLHVQMITLSKYLSLLNIYNQSIILILIIIVIIIIIIIILIIIILIIIIIIQPLLHICWPILLLFSKTSFKLTIDSPTTQLIKIYKFLFNNSKVFFYIIIRIDSE